LGIELFGRAIIAEVMSGKEFDDRINRSRLFVATPLLLLCRAKTRNHWLRWWTLITIFVGIGIFIGCASTTRNSTTPDFDLFGEYSRRLEEFKSTPVTLPETTPLRC
jgi:hypothetical protein